MVGAPSNTTTTRPTTNNAMGGGNRSTATNIGDLHGLRQQELGDGILMARAKLPKGDHSPSKARMSQPNWGNMTCRVCDEAMTTHMEGWINAWVALNKCQGSTLGIIRCLTQLPTSNNTILIA